MSDTTTQGQDARRVYIDKASPASYRAFRKAAEAVHTEAVAAGLEPVLLELVNIRVSQLNGCAFCLNAHTRAALRAGESPMRLGVLPGWRDTEVFTVRERAALDLAEAVTHVQDATAQESAYAAARETFTEAEISAVLWAAITINAFNRVSVLSKHPVRPTATPPSASR
ncbi:carboxymuconolactone decarboxylase family protein [Streptomyces sp. SCSIO 75703]|uniref:carboxymuconolactone decarboxylase family protein n=1 Tax=unclassified Streptomyces TaxID=2593676 RepID=UPI0004C1D018|nr:MULTISPECIES: carboxymuconolactone decarboxylase family protein [unclassified Streptomyces]